MAAEYEGRARGNVLEAGSRLKDYLEDEIGS